MSSNKIMKRGKFLLPVNKNVLRVFAGLRTTHYCFGIFIKHVCGVPCQRVYVAHVAAQNKSSARPGARTRGREVLD